MISNYPHYAFCHAIVQIWQASCLSTFIMPRAIATTKKRKEYATEVTWVPTRTRRGRVKHQKTIVTPSSFTPVSSSPVYHHSQEQPKAIPSLPMSHLSNQSSPPSGVSVDQTDPRQQKKPLPPNPGGHKSSTRGKACFCFTPTNCLANSTV
jgi:hypothetical protein